jgi:hypothetical protein
MAITGTVVAGAAIAGGTTAALAGTATAITVFGFTATLTSLQLGLLVFAASTAIGLAMNALAPKPKFSGGNRGYQVNQRGSALDHQIIYGRVKTGGAIIFDETTGTNNKYLHRIIAFAGHEIEEFEGFYIGDDEVSLLEGDGNVAEIIDGDGETSTRFDNLIRIKKHLGASDQTADTDLVSESPSWTTLHRLNGIAYIYIRFAFSQEAFPNGLPDVTAIIKGKKVYDPRTELTVYSNNPALCIRDYLTSGYGLKESDYAIDDGQVIVTANICDETDTLSGATRYTMNGAFVTSVTPYDLLGDIVVSMGGLLWYSQGKWRMKAAKWTPALITLDEDDFRSSIAVSTRHSRRDNFNTVRGTFRGDETNWQVTDYPEVTSAASVAADNGQESVVDIDLPFTDTSEMARRLARIALERNRQQLTVKASFGMRAFAAQVGDNVKLSFARFGWAEKEFEVIEWTFGLTDGLALQIQMTLREISENVFDEVDDGIVFERDNTLLLNPFFVPSIGLFASSTTQVFREKLVNVLTVVTSASASERVAKVELQYKKSSDTDYIAFGFGSLGKFTLIDLESSDYDVRARAVNSFGLNGEWGYLFSISASGLLAAPSDVTGFTANLLSSIVHLTWNPVPDLDLSYYQIRLSGEEDGGSWANSILMVDKVPRPATSVSVPAKPGTYHIRAYDKSGVASVNYVSATIKESDLALLAHEDSLVESTTFTGTKTGCEVSSDRLIISAPGTAPTTAEYIFSGPVDLYHGSGPTSVRAKFRVDVEVVRIDNNAATFDNLPGLFDDLPGLFDDFTGLAQFSDTDVITYYRITQDDPAGSPTWTAWKPFLAAEANCRGIEAKVVLKSFSNNVTPAISALSLQITHE